MGSMQKMMRTVFCITIAYFLAIAAFMAHVSDHVPSASGLAVYEAIFSTPMIVACLLALFMRRDKSRRVLLMFQLAFSAFTLVVFVLTFAGEHDAQYQLALLLVPLIGIPSVLIAGIIAALAGKQERAE